MYIGNDPNADAEEVFKFPDIILNYDLGFFKNGTYFANEILFNYLLVRTILYPQNFLGSLAVVSQSITNAPVILSILKNNISIGTITFAIGSSIGVFVTMSNISFQPSDILTIKAPAIINSSFQLLTGTLKSSLI